MWDVVLATMNMVQELDWVRALRTSTWAYPLVNAAHIAGFALLFGAIAVVDISILRRGHHDPATDGFSVRIAFLGFGFALASGLVLFAVRAQAYVQNPFMGMKLCLILLAGANALFFHIMSGRANASRISASVSLFIWTATIGSGRLVGFW
ncbi:hypothetical protein L598_008100000050 [Mesorhizobium sp. J18]|uniref:hypothetical protein n=1 Tax=Mesorhizobium sp. J18 TaxID=935263 RepID=UPI0011995F90|nr:hypothetical protein [Mesorhizobium sp. J18]TWG89439.1 hypothetical protein L598_008100000050 [Mesorhizobium sp. J18]